MLRRHKTQVTIQPTNKLVDIWLWDKNVKKHLQNNASINVHWIHFTDL